MTALTPEEIKACKPGDKVRLDGMVLTRSSDGWWNYADKRTLHASILALPGVTITKLEDEDLLLALACAAKVYEYEDENLPGSAAATRERKRGADFAVQAALLAIKAVRGEKP